MRLAFDPGRVGRYGGVSRTHSSDQRVEEVRTPSLEALGCQRCSVADENPCSSIYARRSRLAGQAPRIREVEEAGVGLDLDHALRAE